MPETYHITVGRGNRIKTVKIGKIERGSGQVAISEERGEVLAKRGTFMFPNKCRIWAVRLNSKGEIPKDGDGNTVKLQPTDNSYKGQLKGLKWGDPNGSIIEVRYLVGYPSNDVLFQERVLNFRINEEDESSADAISLSYPNGDVDFDKDSDPYLIQHLKWHVYNGMSISRDPNVTDNYFVEKSFDQIERLDTQTWDEDFEARKVVSETGSGAESVAKCKNLLSIVKSVTDEEPEDAQVYAYLKMISAKRPVQFLEAIKEYKRRVSDVFSKMDSYEIVDLSVDGTLVCEDITGKGKNSTKVKKIILTDLPVKGKDVYDYMLENFTEPKIFNATFDLIQITDKIK